LPTEEEWTEISESYKSRIKHSADSVGKSFTWKVCETKSNYYILKSVLEKKTKLAFLPKPLASAFGLSLQLDEEDFTFDGYVFQEYNREVPIVTFSQLLPKLVTLIPTHLADIQPGKLMMGFIETISSTHGLTLKFTSSKLNQHIAIKDMQHSADLTDHYCIGAPLICAMNKAGRFSCKDVVVHNVATSEQMSLQRQTMLNAFYKVH